MASMICKYCKSQFDNRGDWMRHLGKEHGKGPAAPSARLKAAKAKRLRNAPVSERKFSKPLKAKVMKRKALSKLIVEGNEVIANRRGLDNDVPWNLGLVAALNMARKSIERCLEILE